MEEETHRFILFKLEFYNPIANPLVVITTRNSSDFCRSEFFVLIQPNHLTKHVEDISIKPERLSFNKKDIHTINPELFIDDIEEYMIQQTKEVVENHLKIQLYEKSQKEGIEYENWHLIKLVTATKEDLLGLWMRGKCIKEIEKMRAETRNEELRKFLDKVVEAPIFDIKEF